MNWKSWLGCLDWAPKYNQEWLIADLVAAVVVTIMLIPQSLAYAMIAGLPPEVGLYASMAPLLAYAVFGTSRALAVGPVAVASLMSAAAAGAFAKGDTALFYQASIALALIGGLALFLLGVFRAGFVANMLSHPVVTGFVSASALLIAAGQLGHLIGAPAKGETFLETMVELWHKLGSLNFPTLLLSILCLFWLYAVRKKGKAFLKSKGIEGLLADVLTKAAPVFAIAFSILVAVIFSGAGIKVVGDIPTDLPGLTFPSLPDGAWAELFVPGVLIALVGFVETVSVGHALAAKRKQKIKPDNELLGLGAANIASGAFGGFSVTGGFSRSVVNFDAGAQTPLAGVFTAGGILLATMYLTPLLADLPKATLAATIVVAVLGLIDWDSPKQLWKYSKKDFAAYFVTAVIVLIAGVEAGIMAGVAFSILALMASISQPHWALVGRVPGTEHFRNTLRHDVERVEGVISIRIDESLYFPNARWLEELLIQQATSKPGTKAVVMQCSAINHIDASALEALEQADENLHAMGITLFLSEVKGPVMDRLANTHWFESIAPRVGLTQLGTVEMAKAHVDELAKLPERVM